jgi:hypothetical protein
MTLAAEQAQQIQVLQTEVTMLTLGTAEELVAVDRGALRRRTGELLLQVSSVMRRPVQADRDFTRADLIGRHLAGRDLRRASFLGALLVAADLSGGDLRGADLRGADLRGADLSGADLTDCLFVLQSQVQAARGDQSTRLPQHVTTPAHWLPAAAESGRARP